MERILCILIGYAFGLIQTGYLIGKAKGFDIRSQGSGNAGTTNAFRTMGKKFGILTFAGDFFKCAVAAWLTSALFAGSGLGKLIVIYTAVGVVLGHDFPFYLNFKGGKGIAVTAGLLLAFMDWRLMLIGLAAFVIPFLLSHTVSLGSLVLYAGILIGMILLGQTDGYGMPQSLRIEMYILTAALLCLAYWQHRGNIKRLAGGTERKMF